MENKLDLKKLFLGNKILLLPAVSAVSSILNVIITLFIISKVGFNRQFDSYFLIIALPTFTKGLGSGVLGYVAISNMKKLNSGIRTKLHSITNDEIVGTFVIVNVLLFIIQYFFLYTKNSSLINSAELTALLIISWVNPICSLFFELFRQISFKLQYSYMATYLSLLLPGSTITFFSIFYNKIGLMSLQIAQIFYSLFSTIILFFIVKNQCELPIPKLPSFLTIKSITKVMFGFVFTLSFSVIDAFALSNSEDGQYSLASFGLKVALACASSFIIIHSNIFYPKQSNFKNDILKIKNIHKKSDEITLNIGLLIIPISILIFQLLSLLKIDMPVSNNFLPYIYIYLISAIFISVVINRIKFIILTNQKILPVISSISVAIYFLFSVSLAHYFEAKGCALALMLSMVIIYNIQKIYQFGFKDTFSKTNINNMINLFMISLILFINAIYLNSIILSLILCFYQVFKFIYRKTENIY